MMKFTACYKRGIFENHERLWKDVNKDWEFVRFITDFRGSKCIEVRNLHTLNHDKETYGVYADEAGEYFIYQGDYGGIYFKEE